MSWQGTPGQHRAGQIPSGPQWTAGPGKGTASGTPGRPVGAEGTTSSFQCDQVLLLGSTRGSPCLSFTPHPMGLGLQGLLGGGPRGRSCWD